MKNENKRKRKKKAAFSDIKQIFRNFFITAFMILLMGTFICAITTASDNSRFNMTGKRQDTINAEEIIGWFGFAADR